MSKRPTAGEARKLISDFEEVQGRNGMSSLDLMWCNSITRDLREGVSHFGDEDMISEVMYDKYIQLEQRLRDGASLYKRPMTRSG